MIAKPGTADNEFSSFQSENFMEIEQNLCGKTTTYTQILL